MSGAGSQLHFRGALALPDDNEPSLIVDLRVDNEVVIITQDSEQLGSWPVDEVDAERLNGQKFRLLLGDDEVIFHARDRLGFAYNGLSAIREAKERRAQRRGRWWYEKLVDGGAETRPASEWIGEKLASIKKAVVRPAPSPPQPEIEQAPRRSPDQTDAPPVARSVRPGPQADPGGEAPPTRQPEAADSTPAPGTLLGTESGASDEPWDIPAAPASEESPSEKSRRQPRPRSSAGRHRDEPEDPWAMVADAVLRRDDEAARAGSTSKHRKRRTKRDHVHTYEETRLPGGLVRRVCECGEVVIRSID